MMMHFYLKLLRPTFHKILCCGSVKTSIKSYVVVQWELLTTAYIIE